MSYIGTPPSNAFTSLLKQDFSTSATTGYTLDHAVNNANDIALFINFVRQEPTAGYAASGTSLVLTSATASSDDMYCVYLGQALQTVNPPNVSVGTAQLIDGAVTSAKLADGNNTPSFMASLSSSQSIANSTLTKVQFNNEIYDTNNAYDNSTNYRFTVPSGQAGKYFIYSSIRTNSAADFDGLTLYVFLNGNARMQSNGRNEYYNSLHFSAVDNLSEGDYLEVFYSQASGGSIDLSGSTSTFRTIFGAYKIIT